MHKNSAIEYQQCFEDVHKRDKTKRWAYLHKKAFQYTSE